VRPSLKDVIADNPSEAISSEDMMEIAAKYLEVLACNWTGGTLLHPLLDEIAGNFGRGMPNGPFSEALFFWNKY